MQNLPDKSRYLITGVAGFIGSHLAEKLIRDGHKVVGLDNFATGSKRNVTYLETLANKSLGSFEFIDGDLRSLRDCVECVKRVNYILHLGALGSVPRSIKDPIASSEANVNGFINILWAAHEHDIRRIVFASSSSVYGDIQDKIKVEGREGSLLSPYALTKSINEQYSKQFYHTYKLDSIGLRFFNVFGPRQNPQGPYAAVIPLFIKQALNKERITINGDPLISRDFTYVDNVVEACIGALHGKNVKAGTVYNIAMERSVSLQELLKAIEDILGVSLDVEVGPFREGDIKHSKASLERARQDFNYSPRISFLEGIKRTIEYYQGNS